MGQEERRDRTGKEEGMGVAEGKETHIQV